MDSPEKRELKELMRQKDVLEETLIALQSTSIKGPLVDAEGFPRNDIDVHAERIVRNQIAMGQSDHKNLMKRIEKLMMIVHQQAKQSNTVSSGKTQPASAASASGKGRVLGPADGFYLVEQVSEDSPAKEAGLCIGDKVLKLGPITKHGYTRANIPSATVAAVKEAAESKGFVEVILYRNPEGVMNLKLYPHSWSGRGVLGCKLTEMD